jgi:ABC-type arginine/histidine transport system permease subunit
VSRGRDRIEYVSHERATVEVQSGLVEATEPGGGASGQDNGVERWTHLPIIVCPQAIPRGLADP